MIIVFSLKYEILPKNIGLLEIDMVLQKMNPKEESGIEIILGV